MRIHVFVRRDHVYRHLRRKLSEKHEVAPFVQGKESLQESIANVGAQVAIVDVELREKDFVLKILENMDVSVLLFEDNFETVLQGVANMCPELVEEVEEIKEERKALTEEVRKLVENQESKEAVAKEVRLKAESVADKPETPKAVVREEQRKCILETKQHASKQRTEKIHKIAETKQQAEKETQKQEKGIPKQEKTPKAEEKVPPATEKTPQAEEKEPMRRMQKQTLTVAIGGFGRRTGATHLAIQWAQIFARANKVACVELQPSVCAYPSFFREDEGHHQKNVVYYANVQAEQVHEVFGRSYEVVILDCGSLFYEDETGKVLTSKGMSDWLRADCALLTTFSAVWDQVHLLKAIRAMEKWKKDYHIVVHAPNEQVYEAVEQLCKLSQHANVWYNPMAHDPFTTSAESEQMIEKLFYPYEKREQEKKSVFGWIRKKVMP